MSHPLPDPLPKGVTRGLADATPSPSPAPPEPEPDVPVDVEVVGLRNGLVERYVYHTTARRLGRVRRQVDRLGLRPEPRDVALTPEGLPICPRHEVVMKLREKQGDSWYSHMMKGPRGEELWCRGHAGPDSPGWDAPPPAGPEGRQP